MLRAGGAQHVEAVAIEEDDRSGVDVELKIDVLALVLSRRGADADAGVVDEDVQAPEALAVALHHRADAVLVSEVRRHELDLEAAGAQICGGALEAFGLAGR